MHSPNLAQPLPPHPRRWRRRSDESRGRRVLDPGRLLLGLTVAAVGTLFLLDAAGVLDAGKAIGRWWPIVIVAAGVLTLLDRQASVVRGMIVAGIGVALLLFTTNVLEKDAWNYIWPALVVFAGLVIVARRHGHAVERGTREQDVARGAREQDVVRSTAVFGGPNLVCTSRQFRGARLTAIFGGITLDLRQALPVAEGASINATAAFGGIEILVPKGWRISVRSTPIVGGFDDKTDHVHPPAAEAPMLHVDALTVFGGVDIKHEK